MEIHIVGCLDISVDRNQVRSLDGVGFRITENGRFVTLEGEFDVGGDSRDQSSRNKIYVSVPDLTSIIVKGSAKVTVLAPDVVQDLVIMGAGLIQYQAPGDIKNLNVHVMGTGRVNFMQNQVKSLHAKSHGAGIIEGFICAEEAKLEVRGSGSIVGTALPGAEIAENKIGLGAIIIKKQPG